VSRWIPSTAGLAFASSALPITLASAPLLNVSSNWSPTLIDQITLEKALELVEFELGPEGWRVKNVKGSVYGNVLGDVWCNVRRDVLGDVLGNVWGDVCHNVCHNVWGHVGGTINGRQWEFIETPKEELKRTGGFQ
jgi:hypothetical protein